MTIRIEGIEDMLRERIGRAQADIVRAKEEIAKCEESMAAWQAIRAAGGMVWDAQKRGYVPAGNNGLPI